MLGNVAEEFEGPGLGERMEFAKQLFADDSC